MTLDKSFLNNYLSSDILEYASKFEIPEDYIVDFPNIIEMILRSKSIESEEEKQNWLNLLPLMNDQQLDKLKSILQKEKDKLDEIEKKYEDKKVEIKKKYLMKWQKMGYLKKVSNIREEEKEQIDQDEKEAEELLEKL